MPTSKGVSRRSVLAGAAAAGMGAAAIHFPAVVHAQGAQAGPLAVYPPFFAQVAPITMYDPFAEFLGASEAGRFEYHYQDAVQMAGHSCPIVASAYLIALNGLRRLYGADLPVRGDIQVQLRNDRAQGTTGVTAAVLTLITGATEDTGYPGMGSGKRFSRRQLLSYGASDLEGFLLLRRRDTGKAIQASYHLDAVPADPEMATLLPDAIAARLDGAGQARFAALFQDRVRRMLIEHPTDPDLIRLQDA